MKTDLIGIITFRILELLFVMVLITTIIISFIVPMPPQNKDMILMLIGALISVVTGIAGYEWGSSRSSDRKTEILAGPDPTAKQTTETTTTQAVIK
jgi:hypothetical protein